MNQFVESLLRLYHNHLIDMSKLDELLNANKLNQQEYDYIISAQNAN